MENYQLIKEYLESLPEEMTAKQALDNIYLAEEMYDKAISAKIKQMEEQIGKCYYYEETDDNIVHIKYILKITGVNRGNDDYLMFVCKLIEITDEGTIYYLPDAKFTSKDLREDDIVSEDVFNDAIERYNHLVSFKNKD